MQQVPYTQDKEQNESKDKLCKKMNKLLAFMRDRFDWDLDAGVLKIWEKGEEEEEEGEFAPVIVDLENVHLD